LHRLLSTVAFRGLSGYKSKPGETAAAGARDNRTEINTMRINTAKALARRAAFDILAHTELRDFTKDDWYGFAGCESSNPMIGIAGDFTVVLDGSCLMIVHNADEEGGETFSVTMEDALEDARIARHLFNSSKGGNARGITENDRTELLEFIGGYDARHAERAAYGRPV
jgi:hypothetical protein